MAERVLLVPSAHRMIESMRDIGYDLPTSIADLIDNSIEAKATEIWLDLIFKDNKSCIRIYDNGTGISNTQIDEALRYGSRRDYSNNDLGKFGLGLKTASLSHCRKLSVASRHAVSEEVSIMMWDMNHVEKEDAWEALRLRECEANPILLGKLKEGTGTVVLWEDLDRVSTGSADKETFIGSCRQVEEHLSIAFHRFLGQQANRELPLTIYINGNEIKAWDPFARNEPETKILQSKELFYAHKGKELSIKVQPYILPPEQLFSSKAAHTAAAGPKKWNRQQGLYIYRNDRLIQSGGWNRLRSADEHTKLARIAVDFDSKADESFRINIAKMTVQLPSKARPELSRFASTIATAANKIYREGSMRKVKDFLPVSENNSPSKRTVSHLQEKIAKSKIRGDIEINPVPNLISIPKSQSVIKPHPAPSLTPKPKLNSSSDLFRNKVTVNKDDTTVNIVEIVTHTLQRELSENPELLRRIMSSLAKASPEFKLRQGENS